MSRINIRFIFDMQKKYINYCHYYENMALKCDNACVLMIGFRSVIINARKVLITVVLIRAIGAKKKEKLYNRNTPENAKIRSLNGRIGECFIISFLPIKKKCIKKSQNDRSTGKIITISGKI